MVTRGRVGHPRQARHGIIAHKATSRASNQRQHAAAHACMQLGMRGMRGRPEGRAHIASMAVMMVGEYQARKSCGQMMPVLHASATHSGNKFTNAEPATAGCATSRAAGPASRRGRRQAGLCDAGPGSKLAVAVARPGRVHGARGPTPGCALDPLAAEKFRKAAATAIGLRRTQ